MTYIEELTVLLSGAVNNIIFLAESRDAELLKRIGELEHDVIEAESRLEELKKLTNDI